MPKVPGKPVNLAEPMRRLADDIYYLEQTQSDTRASQDELTNAVESLEAVLLTTNQLLQDVIDKLIDLLKKEKADS